MITLFLDISHDNHVSYFDIANTIEFPECVWCVTGIDIIGNIQSLNGWIRWNRQMFENIFILVQKRIILSVSNGREIMNISPIVIPRTNTSSFVLF